MVDESMAVMPYGMKARPHRVQPPAPPEAPPEKAPPAPAPPEEPPGTRLRSHGLRVGPKAEFSVELPMANSSQLVLPSMTAPSRQS